MPCGRPWRTVKPGWHTIDGKRLKELREARGMSQHRLAVETCICQSVLGRLERGEIVRQTVEVTARIADALGVSEDDITLTGGGGLCLR